MRLMVEIPSGYIGLEMTDEKIEQLYRSMKEASIHAKKLKAEASAVAGKPQRPRPRKKGTK